MPPKKAASAAKKSRTKAPMSDTHKAALAAGREQGRAVRAYLEALASKGPGKRGRKRTPEAVQRRLQTIEDQLVTAEPMRRIQLIQERIDLQAELARLTQTIDLSALEEAFIANAAAYSKSKGISATAWREFGVPADVVRRAGVGR